MTYFKAPVNKFSSKRLKRWFVALVDLGRYGDAFSGFCLYEFTEGRRRIRILASTIDSYGVVNVFEPGLYD
jgi:hypothetical protein